MEQPFTRGSGVSAFETGDTLTIVITQQKNTPVLLVTAAIWILYSFVFITSVNYFDFIGGLEGLQKIILAVLLPLPLVGIPVSLLYRLQYEQRITITPQELSIQTGLKPLTLSEKQYRSDQITDIYIRKNLIEGVPDVIQGELYQRSTWRQPVLAFTYQGKMVRFGAHISLEDAQSILDRVGRQFPNLPVFIPEP